MGGFDMGINVIKETTSVVIHNRKSFSFGVKYLKKKCTYLSYLYLYMQSLRQEKNDIYIILTNSCITQLLIKSILNYFILLQSIRKWKVQFNLSQTNLLYPKLYLLMMAPKIQDSGTRFVTKCNGDLQGVFNRAFVKIKVGFFEFQNSISYSRNSNSSMIFFFCRDD